MLIVTRSPDCKHLAIVGCSGVSIWEESPQGKTDKENNDRYTYGISCWKKVSDLREGNDRIPKHLSWSSDGVLAVSFANAYVTLRRPRVSFMVVKQGDWDSFAKLSMLASIKVSTISPILAWAPSGCLLAASIHNRIVIYELQEQVGARCSLVKVGDLKPFDFSRRNQVQSIAWSVDGFRLATAFAEGVYIWPIISVFKPPHSVDSASYRLSSSLGMELLQPRQQKLREGYKWTHLTVKMAWSVDHRLAVARNRESECETAWVYHRRDDLSARKLLREALAPNLIIKLILLVEDFTFDLQHSK